VVAFISIAVIFLMNMVGDATEVVRITRHISMLDIVGFS
jgi:hypothetical protein